MTDNNDRNDVTQTPVPIDGDLYAISEYLKQLSDIPDSNFYITYLNHLNYFTNLFRLEGDEDVKRLSTHILRQLIEFGIVGVVKMGNGRIVPVAIVKHEVDIYKELVEVEVMPTRAGGGYSKDHETFKVKPEDIVVIKANFQRLPFIYIWKSVLLKLVSLRDAAYTASLSQIKKFTRYVANNNSFLNDLEAKAMLNPKTAHIDVIEDGTSFEDDVNALNKVKESSTRNVAKENKATSHEPNRIIYNNDNITPVQWENLQKFKDDIYFEFGRRTNVNKKKDRNLEGEINADTHNFDVLDMTVKERLERGVDEINKKLGVKMVLKCICEEKDVEKGVSNNGNNNTSKV